MDILHWIRIVLLGGLLTSCTTLNETPIAIDVETPVIISPPHSDGPTPTTHDLDLQEANVLDVLFEEIGDSKYQFEVTLLHDDDGESPSFADSWQVEDLDGIVLGERILTHSHGTTPFTRSATILIPDDIEIVIVRGHDMEHGFGGQAAVVNMKTGEVLFFDEDKGIIPRSFCESSQSSPQEKCENTRPE